MLVRLKLRFWIGSELLRFDKPASKGAFRPLSSMCSWSNMSPLSPVLSHILREYTVYTQLCCSPQARSCMQNQRKCSLVRNLEKGINLWTVFHSVAGPSHFIQHQQITNNLFTASCPLGTSPVLNQLYAHVVYNGKDSVLHCSESLACMFTLCFKVVSPTAGQMFRWTAAGRNKFCVLYAAVGAGRCFHVRCCTNDYELSLCLYSLFHNPLSYHIIGAKWERMFTHLYRKKNQEKLTVKVFT